MSALSSALALLLVAGCGDPKAASKENFQKALTVFLDTNCAMLRVAYPSFPVRTSADRSGPPALQESDSLPAFVSVGLPTSKPIQVPRAHIFSGETSMNERTPSLFAIEGYDELAAPPRKARRVRRIPRSIKAPPQEKPAMPEYLGPRQPLFLREDDLFEALDFLIAIESDPPASSREEHEAATARYRPQIDLAMAILRRFAEQTVPLTLEQLQRDYYATTNHPRYLTSATVSAIVTGALNEAWHGVGPWQR